MFLTLFIYNIFFDLDLLEEIIERNETLVDHNNWGRVGLTFHYLLTEDPILLCLGLQAILICVLICFTIPKLRKTCGKYLIYCHLINTAAYTICVLLWIFYITISDLNLKYILYDKLGPLIIMGGLFGYLHSVLYSCTKSSLVPHFDYEKKL